MKLTTILKVSAISLTAFLASCGDKKDDHAGHDHGDHEGHDHGKKGDHAGHDHDNEEHDHSKCGVVVGPKGGRMIKELAELNLNEAGALTLTFGTKPAEGTKVLVLHEGAPLTLTQNGNVYTSAPIADKLPGEIIVSIKDVAGKNTFEPPFKLEAGKCSKCKHAKLACTCHNHDHGDDEKADDDHKGHDHDKDHDNHKGHDH